uniref:Ribonuclease H-like domain-containing protein n=1 Tax=Tanacetum cinerariifolium TaxID=118510 RepID=A0A6L2JGI3_TANCI|nr:ribonuclease H-like domain-containing protein [Tanacetum cinerariifolium]
MPVAQTTTNIDGTSTTLIPSPITTKEKAQKKNDVKATNMLLMALPNEHLITFNHYKDAKTLFASIQTRFGGNEATKKTQKTLLKQMYENFNAPSTESLDSIFNRLQKIVSQLAILGENILQEDLNLKFLRSLPSEWNTHVVNMAFMSSPKSTNEVNTVYGVNTANTQVSPASTKVSTASTQDSTANLSDATVYAFLASQPNGSQLVHKDLIQIHEDELEEMDLKWTFARECRQPMNQDTRNMNQDSSRRTVSVEETASNAMVAINGAGFDWSYMADDEVPTNMALMDFSYKSNKSEFNLATYKRGLASVEEQLVFYKKNKVIFWLFLPSKLDLSNSSLEEFQQPEVEGYGPKTSNSVSENISNKVKKSLDALLVKELVLDDKLEKKTVFLTVTKIEFVRPKQQEKPVKKPVKYAEMYR